MDRKRPRRKKTPERLEFERQSAANLRRLRELVARGWEELEERRRREPQG